MLLFHRTTKDRADAILKWGFQDNTGYYMTAEKHSGVWLSDVPLDINEGARGDTLLTVDLQLPEDVLDLYEWVEEGKPYREWLIPADIVNCNGTIDIDWEDWALRPRVAPRCGGPTGGKDTPSRG